MHPLPADPLFSHIIEQAIELASEWHDQTYRKSKWRTPAFERTATEFIQTPVMAHVTAVAMILQRAGWDEETVAAGFLHDILEDENNEDATFSYEALCAEMGKPVADRVLGVTEERKTPSGRWQPWRVRKERYIDQLHTGLTEAVAISLADKLHNLWSMNQALAEGVDIFSPGEGRRALSAGPAEQQWYFEAVLAASEGHADPRLKPMRARLREELDRFGALVSE